MDKIQFQCLRCGKGLSAPADKAGQSAKCPSCGAALQIPQAPDNKPKPVAGPPMPPARSASMTPQFYYAQNGQRFGPLTLKQMQEMVASRQLRPHDLVWKEGMSQWVPAQEVPELFSPPAATPTVQPKQPTQAQLAGPVSSGRGQPTARGSASIGAMKLQLLGNAISGAFLRLYCPMRKRREAVAEGGWLLLALLPPAGIFLVGLVLTLVAKGVGIAVIVVGLFYALFAAYVSFWGPTAQKATAALAAIGPRRQELRGSIQQQEKLRQQQKLLRPSRPAPPLPPAGTATSAPLPSLKPSTPECSDCKYRAPRKICAHCESPIFARSIERAEPCAKFEPNPAQSYFTAALTAIATDAPRETHARLLEEAIRGGLVEDEDILARRFLVSCYFDLALERGEAFGVRESPLFAEAAKQLEHAVRVDSEQRYGVYADPLSRAILPRFDIGYSLIARTIQETKGVDAAIKYLEEKLAIFERLPGDPMLNIILDLGVLYYNERKNGQRARVYMQRVLDSRPIPDDSIEDCENVFAARKEKARENLAII